jgi:hypothetical protein
MWMKRVFRWCIPCIRKSKKDTNAKIRRLKEALRENNGNILLLEREVEVFSKREAECEVWRERLVDLLKYILDNEFINPHMEQDLQDSEIEEGKSKTEKVREVKVMKDQLESSHLMQKRQTVGAENPTVVEVPTEVHKGQETVPSQVAAEDTLEHFLRPKAKRKGRGKIISYKIPDFSNVKPKVDNRRLKAPGIGKRREAEFC